MNNHGVLLIKFVSNSVNTNNVFMNIKLQKLMKISYRKVSNVTE